MKILIAYYSKKGLTEKAADALKTELESRNHTVAVEKIKTVRDLGFWSCFFIRILNKECEIHPILIKDVSEYDVVCIGSPNWTKLPVPVAKYISTIKGLKYKNIGFFATTATIPAFEWHFLSAYLLDWTFSKAIEKRGGRVIGSILLSSLFKNWSANSEYGKRSIKALCDKIEAPISSFKNYVLKLKEVEEIRILVVLFSIFLSFSFFYQIISQFVGKSIFVNYQYFSIFAIGFITYLLMLFMLTKRSVIFLGKYLVGASLILMCTLTMLFLPTDLGRPVIFGFVSIYIFVSFFREIKAVLFSGAISILAYFYLFLNYPKEGVLVPFLDLVFLASSICLIGLITMNLQKYYMNLLKAQNEVESARRDLETKVKTRTKELRDLTKNLGKRVEERTKKLEDSKKTLMNILEVLKEEKKKAEKEKNKTLAIISNYVDGLLIFDDKNVLTIANKKAEEFLNMEKKDFINKNSLELSDIPAFKPLVDVLGSDLKDVFRKEFKVEENLILEISIAPIDKEGTGKFVLFHDITREKTLQKLKTEFISIAAHQLRTPLTAIEWAVKMILDGDVGDLNPEQRKLLLKGYKSNRRMAELVDNLLNVARIEEGRFGFDFRKNDFCEIIDTVLDNVEGLAAKNDQELLITKPDDLPKVYVDKEKMVMVMQNILDNALKYTPKDGKVEVIIYANEQDLHVKIKDTGAGIPEKDRSKLFTKFFRASNVIKIETEGSGLGLFIVKNIINRHGGSIDIKSEEGIGTEVNFSVPINKPESRIVKKQNSYFKSS